MYSAFGFAIEQSLDVVWWQLFESAGRKTSLTDVRSWMTGQSPETAQVSEPP